MTTLPLENLLNLKNKSAIITGGAMGIGFGVASRLAEAGAQVFIIDKNEEAGNKAVNELTTKGYKALFVRADVSDEKDVTNAVDFVLGTCGSIDILVNNAGIYPTINLLDMKLEDFQRVIDINLKSAFLFTQAAAEAMISLGKGGRIINITSIDALHPSSVGLAVYDASKHALWGFTKNTALELAPHKIYINAIAPGGIITPGTGLNKPPTKELEEILKEFTKKIPMKRMGDPDEIGKVALFLASDMSSYITGAQIIVDGGVLLA
ncbi:MAG: SDR family NAD(P)-dependent oxidoreductase [Candidatus Paceibacterota bacterium]